MRTKTYRLGTVIRIREDEKKMKVHSVRSRVAELNATVDQLNDVQGRLISLEDRQIEIDEVFDSSVESDFKIFHVALFDEYRLGLQVERGYMRSELFETQIKVDKADARLSLAMNELETAADRLEVLHRHREKWRSGMKAETEHRLRRVNDEIGLNLFNRRRLEELER